MSPRRAIFLTGRREVLDRLHSRTFLVATGLQLAIVLAIVVIAAVTGGDEGDTYDVGAVGSGASEIMRAAERQADAFDADLNVRDVADEAAARQEVDEGELDAALGGGQLIVSASTADDLIALMQSASRGATGTEALRAEGVSAAAIERALNPRPLAVEEVGEGDEGQALAWISALLLYIAILMFGIAVVTGVVEEKSTRVVEVILAAIKPVHLLAGKVAGIGLVGLVQIVLTLAVGLGAALAFDAVDLPGGTGSMAVLIAVYFVLGYLLYASAFALAGSLVSRQEDVNSATSPLTVLLVGGYLLSFNAVESPESAVAVICTFVPLFAPMTVPARAAQDALPGWELAVSLAVTLLAIAALIWLAARVYERAVLRMGAPVGLREALRLARG